MNSRVTANRPPVVRLAYLSLAYGCVGLGTLGLVVPLLPTTPFLIVAAWAASRGSPRLDRWLHQHPRYGQVIRAWKQERAIPVRAKWLAVILLIFSWVVLWLGGLAPAFLAGLTLFFCLVAGFVLSRPSPKRAYPPKPIHEFR